MYRSITLVGAFTGQMWGGGIGFLPFSEDVLAMRRRLVSDEKVTIADIVDSIITEKGGDFQDTKLSGDAYIVIEHSYHSPDSDRKVSRIRYVDVDKLPSLAENVDLDLRPTDIDCDAFDR